MKYTFRKILFTTVIALGSLAVFSQEARFQGAFDYSASTISFKLHAITTGTAQISLVEFFVRVPLAAPAFTWGTLTSNPTNFPGMGSFVVATEPAADASYRYYHFYYTAPQPITTSASYTSGVSYEIFSVTTSVIPGLLNMEMLHSPGDEDPFYLGIANQFGSDLRPLTENTFFYPATDISGDPYFLALSGTVPTSLKDFNVSKKGNSDALLTWITSQEQDVSHFILERSYSQITGWSAIGQVKAKGNSGTPTSYTFEDLNVYDGRAASKVVFYRIRAIDINASEKIFPIRSIKFSAFGAKEISLYPNPANDGFVISIPIVNPGNNKIRLNMVNRLGQVVHVREISAANATNYFYDLKTPGIISGEYMLQIIYDGELLETKKVIVQH
jgi:hypothetical protein